jgi:hypothetical protein
MTCENPQGLLNYYVFQSFDYERTSLEGYSRHASRHLKVIPDTPLVSSDKRRVWNNLQVTRGVSGITFK